MSEPEEHRDAEPRARLPIRRLLALARPEWRLLLPGTLVLLIAAGSGLIYPQVLRLVVDAVNATDISRIDTYALLMVGVVALQSVAIGLRVQFFSVAGQRIVARLREALYRRLLEQEIAFFDRQATGELLSRLASDTTVLQATVTVNASMAARNLILTFGALIFMALTSWKLTLLMLLVVPPLALGAVWMGRFVEKLSGRAQDALASAGRVAEEALSGIRTVRAFTGEEREGRRYGEAVMRTFELARRSNRGVAWLAGVSYFLSFAGLALLLRQGVRDVALGAMTGGELTAFIMYGITVGFSVAGLGEIWAELMRARGASARVFALLDRQPELPTSGGERPASVRGRLELREVSFAYATRPDVPALHGVGFVIEPGEVVALVGPSGAGKSTVAALIPRFYDPQAGAVLLDGTDIRRLDPLWLRGRIGSVAQEPLLFSTTIGENIRYGRPDATADQVEAAARVAHCHEFIVKLPQGYDTPVGERGVQLSGGQRQRVAIARAALRDPAILILDEATSALDAESEALVKDALSHLMRGRTSLVIAHRLSTVKDADRVVVLEAGRVVQVGPHAALMRDGQGLYAQLVSRQLAAV
ncbi:MAG TPA: ABC transporter transmembrane domain-containing protein [Planctomycetota bacterium]|nr:ABC transporter transmembrane domain-containing protein [Planctomycetota bacterium]